MTSQFLTSNNAVTTHPTRGRRRRPRATALASQRVLAGAALGSLIALGTAAAPAFAGTHDHLVPGRGAVRPGRHGEHRRRQAWRHWRREQGRPGRQQRQRQRVRLRGRQQRHRHPRFV